MFSSGFKCTCATQNGLWTLDSNRILMGFLCQCMVLVILYLNQTGTMIYLIYLLCKLALLLNSINIICWICMTKKSDSSWFQFDSNVVCAVTHIRKRIFSKLACFVTFPDHFVLRIPIGNLISIIKILWFWRIVCSKLCLNAKFKRNQMKHSH